MGVEKENPDRAIPIPSPPGDSWPRGIRPGEGRIQVNSLLNAGNECPESARFRRGAIYGPGCGGHLPAGRSEDQEGTDVKSVPIHSNGSSIILGVR